MKEMTAHAAYLHIPFCKKICHYCAFNKYFYDGQPIEAYLRGLGQEMASYGLKSQSPLKTLYIGGGTPSCLSLSELDLLFEAVHRALPLDPATEFSFEINPGELSLEKCHLLAQYGVNRVSMGVQTFNDRLLRQIGRNHREQHIYQSIQWLRQAGFENLSIDLIFRLPNQTLEDFNESLSKALDLDLSHYSLYSLIIENQTVFQQLMREGKLPLPSEDVDADMFQLAIDRLAGAGIAQYEVSNFARPGYESQHNLGYWRYTPYYGFGAGAHGFLQGRRYYNHGPVHHYLKKLATGQQPIMEETELNLADQMEEFLFLALRTTAGVEWEAFHQRFGHDARQLFASFLDQQVQRGLLTCEASVGRLTTKGLFLADTVFRDLIGWLKDHPHTLKEVE